MRRSSAIYLLFSCLFVSVLLQGQEKHRPPTPEDTYIVVPAGTNITVEFKNPQHEGPRSYAAKVVWPVRLGFTTAVPVGAIAKVQVATQYYEGGSVDVAWLYSVLINGKSYPLRTDEQEVMPGFAGEMKFTLTSELRVKR